MPKNVNNVIESNLNENESESNNLEINNLSPSY